MALPSPVITRKQECDHWAHHPNGMDGQHSRDGFGLRTIRDQMVIYPTGSFCRVFIIVCPQNRVQDEVRYGCDQVALTTRVTFVFCKLFPRSSR